LQPLGVVARFDLYVTIHVIISIIHETRFKITTESRQDNFLYETSSLTGVSCVAIKIILAVVV
jgi:hypothetical protein